MSDILFCGSVPLSRYEYRCLMPQYKKPTKKLPDDGSYSIRGHFAQVAGEFDQQGTRPTDEQPYEVSQGVRVESALPELSGFQEVVRFDEAFYLTINDRVINTEFFEKSEGEGWLTFHFRIAGRSDELYGELAEVERAPSYCYIVMQPEGLERGEWLYGGTQLKTVAITFKPGLFFDKLGLAAESLPAPLQEIVQSEQSEFIFQPLPIDASMNHLLRQLIDSPYTGDIRRVMFHAKAIELIGMVIYHLQGEGDDETLPVRLSPRDIELLQQARIIIQERYREVITIQGLSKEVGLNRNKLQYGCKHLFNTTIHNLCLEARMAKACELLEGGELNIAAVADMVGYIQASS
ncbi:MAG: helix-turn-helix transcriptional regulator, partial [Proteobacteria bacterium]|nr:helix-turn-helix transcriptional regulator [Pseudomonadota bacterium]